MRRMLVILALLALVAMVGVGPADAHGCSRPTRYEVGATGQVTIGVPAEEVPVSAVDIVIPPGFRLDEARPIGGWKTSRAGNRVNYSGGRIFPFGCGYFTLVGAPAKKGVLRFELVTYTPEGEVTEYKDPDYASAYSPQIVLAGVDADALLPKEGGTNWRLPVGIGLIVVGVAAGVVLFVRGRRAA